MSFLVRWSPFEVLKEIYGSELVEVPPGCDIISSLPVPVFNKSSDWDMSIVPVKKVLNLHQAGDYMSIFKMHNEGKWSEIHYCCEYHKKVVDKNVMEIRKTSGEAL